MWTSRRALCLSSLAFLASADTGRSYAAEPGSKVRVGILTDMNGPLATSAGPGSVEAARIAIEEFGGSINGRPIELFAADHENKPDVGSAIVRQWFDIDHVDVVADINNSAVGFAVVDVARNRNKAALISGAGSSDFTGKACTPISIQWTWDTYGASVGAVRAIFGPDAQKWYFIVSDFAFGHALARDGMHAVERLGGTVTGSVKAPFNTSDYSSYLLQARQSEASVIALATAGPDTINLVKQAAEFGLANAGMRVVPLQMMLDEVKAIGLALGQGAFTLFAFYQEQSPQAKAWSERFFQRRRAMPTQIQAGTYSAVRHYLQAVKDTDTSDTQPVLARMRATPVNDMFTTGGYIRKDGRMVHDMYLVRVKSPAESTGPWDLLRIVKTVPGDQAFRPLSESECPLVKT